MASKKRKHRKHGKLVEKKKRKAETVKGGNNAVVITKACTVFVKTFSKKCWMIKLCWFFINLKYI